MSEYSKIRVSTEREGRVLRLTLASSRGNVLGAETYQELTRALAAARAEKDAHRLSLVVVGAQGDHFSYGASVQEHRKGEVRKLFASFHELLRAMADAGVPLAALVKGRCLGAGLELAAFCDLVFAEEDSSFGLPEIRQGVFPPVACALLPHRIGSARTSTLILTGKPWTASEAHAAGLVHKLAPAGFVEETFDSWVAEALIPLSASSLRHAARAARLSWQERFFVDLKAVEQLYLEELLETHDAGEGLNAFLEKRAPLWQHGRLK